MIRGCHLAAIWLSAVLCACAPIEIHVPPPVITGCALFPPYPLEPPVEAALRAGIAAGRAAGDTMAVEKIRAHVKAVADHKDVHAEVCAKPKGKP